MLSCVCPCLRALSLESELGECGFFVNVVGSVNDQVFCLGHVGAFVAAGRVNLDDEGFAASCVLEECDAPDAALPFAPADGFHVDVANVVCHPRLRDDDAGRLVVVECDGGGGVGFWVSCEPVARSIVVEPFVASAGGEDGAHHAALNVRGDGGVGVGVVGVVDHGVFSFLNVSRCL